MPRQPSAKRSVATSTTRRKTATDTPATDSVRESRGARNKREARERLLEAALALMAERGMEGVTINEMTASADIALGSFYSHFESKEAIHAALVKNLFEDYADAVDRLIAATPDLATGISFGIRHTVQRALQQPLWGKLLVRESYSSRVLKAGPGVRLLRDLHQGIVSGRFKPHDPMMSFLAAGGTILAAIAAASQSLPGMTDEARGLHDTDMPERTATMLLNNLGVPWDEAVKISRLPLLPLNFEP